PADVIGPVVAFVAIGREVYLGNLVLHAAHESAVVDRVPRDPEYRVATVRVKRPVLAALRKRHRFASLDVADISLELGTQHHDPFVGGAKILALVDVDRPLARPCLPVARVRKALFLAAMRTLAIEIDSLPADLAAVPLPEHLVFIIEVTPAELAAV